MFTVHDQIEHEKEHADLSAQRYYLKQDTLRDNTRGDEADASRSIMRKRIADVGRTIETLSTQKSGIGGKYNRLLKTVATFDDEVDYDVLAFMGIQAIFQSLGKERGNDWVTVATTIASKLEFEHKTRKFENENPGYYHAVMNSMEEQQVSSYEHKRKVLSKKMTDFNMAWDDWDNNTKIQIANKILIAIMHNLDDVFFRNMRYFNGKTIAVIDTTAEADEWFADFEAERGFLNPVRLPMLIKPQDWLQDAGGDIRGGYYSVRLSNRVLVKAHAKDHIEYLKGFAMEQHISAINKLQATEWKINSRVFKVQHEMFAKKIVHPGVPAVKPTAIPAAPSSIEGIDKESMTEGQLVELDNYKQMVKAMHRADKSRKGKVIQFKMSFDLARMYKDYDKFHFVYTPDFRGRIYSDTTGLSPQSNDTSKALLQFANGKEVTEAGIFWLAVHGANTYGKDKLSYHDRKEWIDDQTDIFKRIIGDPIGNKQLWEDADKPWQFLAFLYAWADTSYGKDTTAIVNVPIGLDGSCNGLQHYSALLRDKVGGAGVNLIDSTIPADIYADVSTRLELNLRSMGTDEHAQLWLRTGLGRKLTKRPVMTLPYGSTQTSARAYIYEWAMENEHKFPGMNPKEIYTACIWITPYLWDAISETVIAARQGMDWIQSRVVKLVRDDNSVITWTSPVGFPVYQPYMVQTGKKVNTRTTGGIMLPEIISTYMQEDTEDVSRTKQRSGIAPNFVHSLDSSHMVMVINNTNFTDYAMIHDDFGTHAADTDDMWNVIREQFVKLYSEVDPLLEWSKQQGDYTGDFPDKGELDINSVLDSQYFFG